MEQSDEPSDGVTPSEVEPTCSFDSVMYTAVLIEIEETDKDARLAQMGDNGAALIMAGCEGAAMSMSLIPCGCGAVDTKYRPRNERQSGQLMTGWTEKEWEPRANESKPPGRAQSARRRYIPRALTTRSNTTPDLLRNMRSGSQSGTYTFHHHEDSQTYIQEYRQLYSSIRDMCPSSDQLVTGAADVLPDLYPAKLPTNRNMIEKSVLSNEGEDTKKRETPRTTPVERVERTQDLTATKPDETLINSYFQKQIPIRSIVPVTRSTLTPPRATCKVLVPRFSSINLHPSTIARQRDDNYLPRQAAALPGKFARRRSEPCQLTAPSKLNGTSSFSTVTVSRLSPQNTPSSSGSSSSSIGHLVSERGSSSAEGGRLPPCVNDSTDGVPAGGGKTHSLPLRLVLCPDSLSVNGAPRCMARKAATVTKDALTAASVLRCGVPL